MRRVLIDTNVAVDFFLKRETFGDKVKSIALQIMFVLLLAILTSGCKPGQPIATGEQTSFEVDGVMYCLHWQVGNPKVHDCSSCLMVIPESDHGIAALGTGGSPRPGRYMTFICHGANSVLSRANTVYYVTNKGIEFSKTYAELGIDAAFFDRWNSIGTQSVLAEVQPALEKMIREHVTPKETETKE